VGIEHSGKYYKGRAWLVFEKKREDVSVFNGGIFSFEVSHEC
jgi:hypothetical protein